MAEPFVSVLRTGDTLTLRLHRFDVDGDEYYLDFTYKCNNKFEAGLVKQRLCARGWRLAG